MRFWQRTVIAVFEVLRPTFGFMGCSCIYPVSCSDYAKHMLTEKPGLRSVLLVTARVISCNPITALIIRFKKKQ